MWVAAATATGCGGSSHPAVPADSAIHDTSAADVVSELGIDAWAGPREWYLKASNTRQGVAFGYAVAIAGDGNTLAVGEPGDWSAATGINGNQADASVYGAGAVYVFTRSGTTWAQQAYIKASNAELGDIFGVSVSLSADGNLLAAGAYGEASSASGIDGSQADNTMSNAGAVYTFVRSGATWQQDAY